MHLQPVFAGCETVGGSVAESLFRDGLCLPSGSNTFTSTKLSTSDRLSTGLSQDDLNRVVEVIRSLHGLTTFWL